MQHLEVKLLNDIGVDDLTLTMLSERMDGLPKHPISEKPWAAYPYHPKATFTIAHTGHDILLKYYVEEAHLRCVNVDINAPVYEDSCVEIFIAFDEAGYYNLEFNCLGTALVGYGQDRSHRSLLEGNGIRRIKYAAKLSNERGDLYQWELMLMIPVPLFKHHSINSLSGLVCKANFYKCGDLTQQPHYLSWRAIEAPEPDFHLPQFFGTLIFQ